MEHSITIYEQNRIELQKKLDSEKSQDERNRLGQFATPKPLALDILQYASTMLPSNLEIRFLDPAFGTGAFYSALTSVFPRKRITEALGYEIDSHYGKPAMDIWKNYELTINIDDFTKTHPSSRFNLIICNPPYVRHHHIEYKNKIRLQQQAMESSSIKISGLAGLYCYFLLLSHTWMCDDGIAGWLIPSEFMDVNYGKGLKNYLLNKVTLLHIHRFDPSDVQFSDALVSSAVVWFRKSLPLKNHSVIFSFGGNLSQPNISRHIPVTMLLKESKWTRFPNSRNKKQKKVPTISDFFQIKRGIATGGNSYFILNAEEIASRNLPMEMFKPILPSPRYLPNREILSDENGFPLLERQLFLLDIRLQEDEIEHRYTMLSDYLEYGKSLGIHQRYLCRHRKPWYYQENRPPSPIVCTYMGRRDAKGGSPFRFILNKSQATIPNVYLAMYPTSVLKREIDNNSELIDKIWKILNQITPEMLIDEGRVYGGGLHKLEPKELANVDASMIAALIPGFKLKPKGQQLSLFESSNGVTP